MDYRHKWTANDSAHNIYRNQNYQFYGTGSEINLFDMHNKLTNGESIFVMPLESALRAGSSTDFDFNVIAGNAHHYNIISYGIKEYVETR